MNICIVGAGAIGGYLGAKLAAAGEQVTLIARGAHLAAIQRSGLQLHLADRTVIHATPTLATDDLSQVPPQDVVVLALKSHQVLAIAPLLPKLYHPETIVVTAQNGIPWWYFRKQAIGQATGRAAEYANTRIQAVDPEGIIEANIGAERVIGCVVYPAATIVEPGVIRHIEGDRFTLGEIDGNQSDRLKALAQVWRQAGIKAPIRPQIRNEIWVKLWGNVAFNPISALTGATLAQICQYPPTRRLAQAIMEETQAIGQALGIEFGISLEQRIQGAQQVGEHKTSMLQDIEAGRLTEVDAIVGAVVELGQLTRIPTPHLDTVYANVKLLEQVKLGEQARARVT